MCREGRESAGENRGAGRGLSCPANRDKLYTRRDILEQFADILNASIPEFERERKFKFHVEKESAVAFQVAEVS
jgi:hypothetical protein